jgi:putative ABC transport system permease protein
MQSLLQDMRYGAKLLFKNPGFTVVAVIAITLGIGANTAIFSVVNAVLLRPLPYHNPEQLVAVWESNTRKADHKMSISYPDFFDWRERNQSFEGIAIYRNANFSMTDKGQPVQLSGQIVSAELFDMLQVRPTVGRNFVRDDEKVGGKTSSRAAILSQSLWQRVFGGDQNIVGQTITLNRKAFEVVGVMPAGFQFPIQADPIEIWVTPAVDSEPDGDGDPMTQRRGFRFLHSIARLKSGVTMAQAQAEMDGIAKTIEEQYPDNNTYTGVRLIPFHKDLVSDYSLGLIVLTGAVGCVLLIACANVANLMLARTTARYKEIAVRAALGAGRLRLIRQLLTESLLLSIGGGILGLLLAWWGIEVLIKLIPEDLPRLAEISVDRSVLGFTFLLSLITGVLFGVIPAIQGSKTDLNEAMKEGARGNSGGYRTKLRSTLVVVEVAIALVLLTGAGLLGQTFLKLQNVNLGFDTHNVLTAMVELPEAEYSEPEKKIAFYQQFLERVKTLPGVNSASGVLPMPISGDDANGSFGIAGRPTDKGEEPQTDFQWIQPDYFQTMKIGLVDGREFSSQDRLKSAIVVIVNETFANRYFPGELTLGKQIYLPFSSGEKHTTPAVIVGIVKDTKQRTALGEAVPPIIYISYAQLPFLNQMSLVVRTDTDPKTLAKAIQTELTALDKELPLSEIKTLDQYLGNAVAQPKFSAVLFGLFAAVALLLSAVGLYGVLAYSVSQRTHEIGIRLALGAQKGDVLRMVIRQGMTLVGLGVGLGLISAYAATRLVETLLFGVSATDTLTFVGVVMVLGLAALIACAVPALRATKTDPMIALRYE